MAAILSRPQCVNLFCGASTKETMEALSMLRGHLTLLKQFLPYSLIRTYGHLIFIMEVHMPIKMVFMLKHVLVLI